MIPTGLLQTTVDDLTQNFFEAIIGPYADVMGVPVLALMVFGSIGLAYYQVQRKAIIPVITLILVGGVTIGFAPQSAGNAIIALVVVATTALGYILYQRAREGT